MSMFREVVRHRLAKHHHLCLWVPAFAGTTNPMTKATLALLIHGGTENWSPARWKARFDAACGDRPVHLLPDAALDPAAVQYAAVWKPRPGELAGFPNLRVIFNLGAGVDALTADP